MRINWSNRHVRRGAIASGAVVIVAALAVGASSFSASASSSAGAVTPAVTTNGQSFYTGAQIDQEWASVTANYPQPLPAGQAFPVTAPAFFDHSDGKEHLYQTGLPEEIAAQYWRCAWLDVSQGSHAARSAAATDAAVTSTDSNISKFADLPGIKGNGDFSGYDAKMKALGDHLGVSADQAEFQANCGPDIYVKTEATK